MDANAINAIQDKLRRQADALRQNRVELPPDWPASPGVKIHSPSAGVGSRPAQLSTALEMLQRRGQARGVSPHAQADPSRASEPRWVDPPVYQQQLLGMVETINQLSRQQEQAIAELYRLQAQWAEISPVEGWGQGWPTIINLKGAAIAKAGVDAQGNVILNARAVRPPQPEQEAHHLAAHLRQTYGPAVPSRPSLLRGLLAELRTLWQEPGQGLTHGWHTLRSRLAQGLGTVRGRRLPLRQPLTWLDAVLWFGGGVVGRQVLSLLLISLPQLSPLAVIVTAAAIAYALFQATLAPKPDVGVAIRVLLAVVGLIVGGQF